jgi:hypothetical protein
VQRYIPERAGNFVALELGTGWFPIIPVGLALAGASAIYTVDMHDLTDRGRTLETHIPADAIASMFTEFRRLLRPPGVMSHFIDMADHYALFDRKITRYNFLRYSDPVWWLFNNSLHYQNRLRLPDFRALHEQCGFEVLEEENRREPLERLRSVPLTSRFVGYAEDDLAVYDSWMISRPRG